MLSIDEGDILPKVKISIETDMATIQGRFFQNIMSNRAHQHPKPLWYPEIFQRCQKKRKCKFFLKLRRKIYAILIKKIE